jgi:hypothetical protein
MRRRIHAWWADGREEEDTCHMRRRIHAWCADGRGQPCHMRRRIHVI